MQVLQLFKIYCLTLLFHCCILFMAQSIAPDEFRRPSWAVTHALCGGLSLSMSQGQVEGKGPACALLVRAAAP